MGRKERRMRKITLAFDEHSNNILTYLEDKYKATPAELIIEALNNYYAEEIEELERKEE